MQRTPAPQDQEQRRLPSRRDRGITALILGFFGFVWFGWGQADASAGLRVALAVGGVLALLVAVAGGVQAFRSPASDGTLHDRRAWRRYGLIVGVEFALAGAGAAALAAVGQSDYIPVWVCAVVAVHLFPLASVLRDRLLVALGMLLAAVALAALAAGLGAGVLLTLFAATALAGVEVGRRARAPAGGSRPGHGTRLGGFAGVCAVGPEMGSSCIGGQATGSARRGRRMP